MRLLRLSVALAAALAALHSIHQVLSARPHASPIVAALPATLVTGFDHRVVEDPVTNWIVGLGATPVGTRYNIVAIDARTGRTTAQVSLEPGLQPGTVGLDTTRGRIVVAASRLTTRHGKTTSLQSSGVVLLLDRRSLRVVGRRSLGSVAQPLAMLPQSMAVSSKWRRAVLVTGGGTVITMNLDSLAVIKRVAASRGMQGQAVIDDRTRHAFVSTVDGVVMLNVRTGAVQDSIKLGGAQRIVLDSARGLLVAATMGSALGIVSTSTGKLLHTVSVGVTFGIGLDPVLGRIYLGVDSPVPGIATVDEQSGKQIGKTTPALGQHFDVGVDSRTGHVYITAELANTLTIMDARTRASLSTVHLHSAGATAHDLSIIVSERTSRAFVLGWKMWLIDTKRT